METKKELRALFKSKRAAVSLKQQRDADIIEKIKQDEKFKEAKSLFLYYPIKGEIDLLPLAEHAISLGKRVAFPRCLDKNGEMEFYFVSSVSCLTEGSFGTLEPPKSCMKAEPKDAVIILPALSIDKKGYRLGYGMGYYDRYLKKFAHLDPYTVGAVYSPLLQDALPKDSHDIPCKRVICDSIDNLN